MHVVIGQGYLITTGINVWELKSNKIQAKVDQELVGKQIWIEPEFIVELSEGVGDGRELVLIPNFRDDHLLDPLFCLLRLDRTTPKKRIRHREQLKKKLEVK